MKRDIVNVQKCMPCVFSLCIYVLSLLKIKLKKLTNDMRQLFKIFRV